MVSWNIALILILMAMALPFLFLSRERKKWKREALNSHEEAYHLRRIMRELEERILHDQEFFLEALGVPFLLLRPSGRIVMINERARQLLNIEENVNLLNHLPPGDLRSSVQQAILSAPLYTANIRLDVRGEERIYHLTTTRLKQQNEHIGLVFNDMTEEHRTQIIRRDFVANASHELRTPLTIIKGYIETLLDEPETANDPNIRERALAVMKKHADRIVRLIENILTLYKLESPEDAPLNLSPFHFDEIVEDTLLRLEAIRRKQQATFHCHFQPTPFPLKGDKFYWSQILFNLLENALKNNPNPGLVITISADLDHNGAPVITIEDNGTGIPAEALPYIFNRFFRAKPTGTVKGTGLGLAIVRHAVEAHGLRIRAASTPGVRTTFTISR